MEGAAPALRAQPTELAQGVVVWCSFLMFSVLLYGNFFPPPLPQCYVEGNETLHQLILLAGGKQNWGRKAEKSKLAVTKKKKKKSGRIISLCKTQLLSSDFQKTKAFPSRRVCVRRGMSEELGTAGGEVAVIRYCQEIAEIRALWIER